MKDKILVLHCAESGRKALAKMAGAGHKVPKSVVTFELPCTGRVNEVLLMETLQNGFDGVLVVGCHKDNCKYLDGNLRAEKRVVRIKDLLAQAGVPDKDVEMLFISPDEGNKLHENIMMFKESVEEVER